MNEDSSSPRRPWSVHINPLSRWKSENSYVHSGHLDSGPFVRFQSFLKTTYYLVKPSFCRQYRRTSVPKNMTHKWALRFTISQIATVVVGSDSPPACVASSKRSGMVRPAWRPELGESMLMFQCAAPEKCTELDIFGLVVISFVKIVSVSQYDRYRRCVTFRTSPECNLFTDKCAIIDCDWSSIKYTVRWETRIQHS